MFSLVSECLFIFIFALLAVRYIRDHAIDFGLLDVPNNRSSHTKTTPRGAGIGFFLAIALISPFFHLELILEYFYAYIAIFMVFIIGVLDDHKDTSPRTKFLVIIIAVLFLALDDIIIYDIGSFFGVDIHLGWFAIPFTIFAVTGFTNALNLIDGLDGLSASVSIVIFISLSIIGYLYNDSFILTTSATFIIALLAFLVFNWHPASIFMGDSGSLTLGFVIAMLSIKSLAYIPALSILFIAAIPIFDTLIVMIRRKRNGKSIFYADTCHIHHLLLGFWGGDVRKTVLSLVLLQSIYTLIGLQIHKSNNESSIMLLLFILNTLLLYLMLNRMIKKQNKSC